MGKGGGGAGEPEMEGRGGGAQGEGRPFARTFNSVAIMSFATSPSGPVLPRNAAASEDKKEKSKEREKKHFSRVNYTLVTRT